jgi:hypothetical protein
MDSKSSAFSKGQTNARGIREWLKRAEVEGKRIDRPRVTVSREVIFELRAAVWSWAQIARRIGAGGTVRQALHNTADPSRACQGLLAGIV